VLQCAEVELPTISADDFGALGEAGMKNGAFPNGFADGAFDRDLEPEEKDRSIVPDAASRLAA
jgi:hypothetical protein